MTDLHFDRSQAASELFAARDRIAARLAEQVAGWAKYVADYAADPAAFAQLETAALVDYLTRIVETGDDNFRHLYIGEKAKQFYDPETPVDEARRRQTMLLAGERAAFVETLSDISARAYVDAQFDIIEQTFLAEPKATVKVLLIGDCLHLDVIAFLTAPALADGVRLAPTFVTSHDATQIRAQLAGLADERFDIVFYSPFTYALLTDYEALQRPRGLLNPRERRRHISAAVETGAALFDVIADLFDCPIVAHAPAALFRHDGGRGEKLRMALTAPARRAAAQQLGDALRARAATRVAQGQIVHILDEQAVIGQEGLDAAGRYLYNSWMQHPAAFGAMLAPWYRDLLFVIGRLLKRKLIACDLDNTLWQGVIGEGLGVTHHYDRQAPLLTLKERGVVLAINSKNDPAKAIWVAEPGRLAPDHFVSRQINWDPKPLNMQRIAQHLNLKEKDFVFIDDRADERAMVEERFPDLLTLDALDPRSWRLLTLWAELLPAKPGADRTEFYRQRDQRQKFIAEEAEMDAEQRVKLFAQLDLELVVRQAGERDVARVADLINRTNQFNTTGSRVTERHIRELVTSGCAAVMVGDAADRFGTMGTIAVLIAERETERTLISTFVLSCRVFGYEMELALVEQARKLVEPGSALDGPLIETSLNQPCRDVYRRAGFSPVEGGWRLEQASASAIELPAWLTVRSEVAGAAGNLARVT